MKKTKSSRTDDLYEGRLIIIPNRLDEAMSDWLHVKGVKTGAPEADPFKQKKVAPAKAPTQPQAQAPKRSPLSSHEEIQDEPSAFTAKGLEKLPQDVDDRPEVTQKQSAAERDKQAREKALGKLSAAPQAQKSSSPGPKLTKELPSALKSKAVAPSPQRAFEDPFKGPDVEADPFPQAAEPQPPEWPPRPKKEAKNIGEDAELMTERWQKLSGIL